MTQIKGFSAFQWPTITIFFWFYKTKPAGGAVFLHTTMYVTAFKTTKESHSELIKSPGSLV